MIRWRKVWAVASFEFRSEIRRISYLIGVFGMPVFLLAYGGFISLVGTFVKKTEAAVRVYGVVDRAGVLGLEGDLAASPAEIPKEVSVTLENLARQGPMPHVPLWWGNVIFRPYQDEGSAMAALRDGTLKGWFLLAEDYLRSGAVDGYYAEWAGLNTKDAQGALRGLLQDRLMRGRVPDDVVERVRNPVQVSRSWTLKADGELAPRSAVTVIARFAVPLIFTVLLFISVFGTSMSLIQGTAVEKENRVVEVLLSSASPDEILTGKLLGLGAAGLLQITVWFGMAGVAGLLFAGAMTAMGVEIMWSAIAAGFVFFLAGYLFLGSLMLGTGSLGSNAKEGQQWSIVWTLMSALPMGFIGLFIEEPHGTLARLFTWVPFASPTLVVFRMSMDPAGIAWWEVLGSLAFLVLCTWFALRLGARLFRVGLLLTGGRVGLREVLRQARLSG